MVDLPPAAQLEPGAVVGGRFKVERLVGMGGMGAVYAARHLVTGREVALKVIQVASAAGHEQVRRFLREAKAATAVRHPNVIEVLDLFEDERGSPVMVMELLQGEPLSSLMVRQGPVSLHEAARILVPVLRGVHAAHEKRIVHRDLKPDNIFLVKAPGGAIVPKVLDFGIAKVLDPAQIGGETGGDKTQTASVLGTPHYMSFEQAMSDKSVDQRTDIWSLGCIFYELLTGHRPIEFENLGQMYRTFLTGTVPKAVERLPELPAEIAAALDHCLHKEPEGRLDDLRTLIDVLSPLAEVSAGDTAPIRPPPARTATGPNRARRALALGVPIVCGASLIGWLALRTAPTSGIGASAEAPPSVPAVAESQPPPKPAAPDSGAPSTSAPPAAQGPSTPPKVTAGPKAAGRASAVTKPEPTATPTLPSAAPARSRGIVEALPY